MAKEQYITLRELKDILYDLSTKYVNGEFRMVKLNHLKVLDRVMTLLDNKNENKN